MNWSPREAKLRLCQPLRDAFGPPSSNESDLRDVDLINRQPKPGKRIISVAGTSPLIGLRAILNAGAQTQCGELLAQCQPGEPEPLGSFALVALRQ